MADQHDGESEAKKYLNNFLAIVSHELNTPLMGVLGSVQMLEEMFPQEKEYIPLLRKNAEQLREKINRLLELSRADAGALRVKLSELDLENFIKISCDSLRPDILPKGFDFDTVIEADVPRICGDSQRLRQVFESLVLNAVKFSVPQIGLARNKGAKIRVKLSLESMGIIPAEYFPPDKPRQTGLYLVVTVASSLPSIGEKPQNFEQLFEPFSPWRNVDSRAKEGLGIELALSREILLAHSGFIWASDPLGAGEGWCFRFALPILSREEELDLVINNRLHANLGGLNKVSLLLIKPNISDPAQENLEFSELAQKVQSLLFRSSDSIFWVPETGEVTVLMDDCDNESAQKVGERLLRSLKNSLPQIDFVWTHATGPDHGSSAEKLLAAARMSWRGI